MAEQTLTNGLLLQISLSNQALRRETIAEIVVRTLDCLLARSNRVDDVKAKRELFSGSLERPLKSFVFTLASITVAVAACASREHRPTSGAHTRATETGRCLFLAIMTTIGAVDCDRCRTRSTVYR